MVLTHLIPLGRYAKLYRLKKDVAGLTSILNPTIDINDLGLIMHGSEKNPYSILTRGLIPHDVRYTKNYTSEPQVCLGLNSTAKTLTIIKDGSRKNTAVKYAGFFNKQGVIYIISDDVKSLQTYKESWEDFGGYNRGYAWVEEIIPPSMIVGVITRNIPMMAAAIIKSRTKKPIFTLDGKEYMVEELK